MMNRFSQAKKENGMLGIGQRHRGRELQVIQCCWRIRSTGRGDRFNSDQISRALLHQVKEFELYYGSVVPQGGV